MKSYNLSYLKQLESESIHIIRETVAEFKNPVMLYSVGKDSSVMVRLAQKAFHPGKFPFPLMHVDTGYKFPEMYEFREKFVAGIGAKLIVERSEEWIGNGCHPLKIGVDKCCSYLKTGALLDALKKHGFDAAFGGARREEEKSRAKERIFSVRDEFGQWDPKNQRPELWDIYNTRVHPGENIRVFPISNWTEMDIWQYIEREQLEIPSIYFAHEREVIQRAGGIMPVSHLVQPQSGEKAVKKIVRFRTVGDITCTCPVESPAKNAPEIIAETALTRITERGATRMDDQTSDASMELRKKEGYF